MEGRAACPRHGERRMESDGPIRWCGECAWEDPANPAEVPPPKEEKQVETAAGIESIGTKELARMCKARIGEIEDALLAADRKYREQTAAARVELGRLRKIVAFCEGGSPSSQKPYPKPATGGQGSWTCADCGHIGRGPKSGHMRTHAVEAGS